jgi:rhodanese-related sulfurtransferase
LGRLSTRISTTSRTSAKKSIFAKASRGSKNVLAGSIFVRSYADKPAEFAPKAINVYTIPRVKPQEVNRSVRDFESPLILDVREALEHEKFHILGTVNLPFSTTTKEHVADMPKSRPIYVHTVSGPDMVKALQFAEFLESLGHTRVNVIEGGPEEMRTQGAFYYYKDVAWFEEEERKKKEAAAAAAAGQTPPGK